MSRITLERVTEAYEKIGYKPIARKWLIESRKECCPLTAISIAERGIKVDNLTEVTCTTQLSPEYVTGFIQGFDVSSASGLPFYQRELYNLGYSDGKKIREALGDSVRVLHEY